MGDMFVAKSRTVRQRDEFGRFSARCSVATADAVRELVEKGAAASTDLAPEGKKIDTRPGHHPLKSSIESTAAGFTGYWYSTSLHAMPIEKGASAHPIHGKLHFTWKRGTFVWNDPRFDNWDESGATVNHPGNAAQSFLEAGYNEVVRGGGTIRIVKRNYRKHGLS